MRKVVIAVMVMLLWLNLAYSGCTPEQENPSYNEVMNFLREDKTEQANYESHVSYTYQFIQNAKEKGITGYPAVVLIPGRVLVFAGFKTSDKDWIYILPAIDREVKLEKNESYQELNGHSPFGPGDDVIQEIMIFQ